MARFVLEIRFKDEEQRLKVRPAHRAHLAELHRQGKLVTAGPWADDSGALQIFEVADEAEVRELLAGDPYTQADVYDIVRLTEWRPILP